MNNHEEDFADLLGRYLVHTGLSQQELAKKVGVHRNTIVNWMNRSSRPESRGQVLRLADELFLVKEERKALIQAAGFSVERWPVEVWTIPQQRDMFFTGRDDVFQSLRELLIPGSTAQALSGLGGIGKTHMAIEYAYRFQHYYEAVLFLQADSWEILVSACIKLADELGLLQQKEVDQIVAEVRRWLRKHRLWLLILDNVENPQEILPNFVPAGHQGSVLVTTQVHDVEPLAQTQVLSMMSEKEAILFLLHRTKKVALAAGLEQANSAQYDEAKEIWQLMDGLPLALDQAGAYILETGCSFSAYREQYTRRRTELLHRRGKRFIGHTASVTTTFSLVFEQVEALNPVAADILRACSLLYSEAIPEDLFQEGAEYLGSGLVAGSGNLDLAIGLLQDYSLVQRNTDAKTLTMHQLVQAVLKDGMDERTQHQWAERTTQALNAIFPEAQYETWTQCEQLLPHVLTIEKFSEPQGTRLSERAFLLRKTGDYLCDRARYDQADRFYEQALRLLKQTVGSDHREAAFLFNSQAILHREQGQYKKARVLVRKALNILKRKSEANQSGMALLLHNLAVFYKEEGQYEKAEPLYEEALDLLEQTVGPNHPLEGFPIQNEANLEREQGRDKEAEPLYRRALHILEEKLGPDHPQVAFLFHNLAELYREQGKYEEAEALFQRALNIRKQEMGPDHPQTASSLNGLASLYCQQGKYKEAEGLYQQALEILEQKLGLHHPDVNAIRHNQTLLKQALEAQEPSTLSAKRFLKVQVDQPVRRLVAQYRQPTNSDN